MFSRLEQVYRDAERLPIDKCSKIVCMSDCHRGVGNRGDNFLPNRHLFLAALRYYYNRCFWYFELGDGDELWENVKLDRIAEIHSDVFEVMEAFHNQGRFRMLYGNHDYAKKDKRLEIFPGLCAGEGIVLTEIATGHEIFLVHGHQGDFWNDTLAPVAGLMVRFVWRPLELLGFSDPTSAARNYKKCKKTEKRLDAFSRKKEMIVIAGHTHRSMLPTPGDGFYFNDGSCVHPKGITALELENGMITLVRWSVTAGANGFLAVRRENLAGPEALAGYWKKR